MASDDKRKPKKRPKPRTDLTKGIYRHAYSTGYQRGRRINGVSFNAEGWFTRCMLIADDYGHFEADPFLCRIAAAPLRKQITDQDVDGWLKELSSDIVGIGPLITFYEVKGECYGEIVDWALQPAPRNGRRIQKFPGQACSQCGKGAIYGLKGKPNPCCGGKQGRVSTPGGKELPPTEAGGQRGVRGNPEESVMSPGESATDSGESRGSHPHPHPHPHPQSQGARGPGGKGVQIGFKPTSALTAKIQGRAPMEEAGVPHRPAQADVGESCRTCRGGRIYWPNGRIRTTCDCPEGKRLARNLAIDRDGTERARREKEARGPDLQRTAEGEGPRRIGDFLPDRIKEARPE